MNLSSVMINLSWFCDFSSKKETSCPYCWVTAARHKRSRKQDRPVDEWLTAIRKHIPESTTIDFVGGEPTLVPNFHDFLLELSRTHKWAVSSNMGGDRWKIFKKHPLTNGLSWTASYHHTSPDSLEEFAAKCLSLLPHYPLSVNVVEFPSYDAHAAAEALRQKGLRVNVSPYEDVRDLNTAGPCALTCNGGICHAVITPDGYIYSCLSQERRKDRERWRIGNIFDEKINWPTKRFICFIPCDQYYTLDIKHTTKDMWGLYVREIELPVDINLEDYRKTFLIP